MPVAYYLVPMEPGPYSRTNKQRPQFMDEIKCNWTGYPLMGFDRYLCKVNTTAAKHADLESRAGVWAFPPDGLNTVISTLHPSERNRIQQALNQLSLPYYNDETLRNLIQRVIMAIECEWGSADRATELQNMPGNSQARTANLFNKWGIQYQLGDTLEQLLAAGGDTFWNPEALVVQEF